jgi:hypothetical protein
MMNHELKIGGDHIITIYKSYRNMNNIFFFLLFYFMLKKYFKNILKIFIFFQFNVLKHKLYFLYL